MTLSIISALLRGSSGSRTLLLPGGTGLAAGFKPQQLAALDGYNLLVLGGLRHRPTFRLHKIPAKYAAALDIRRIFVQNAYFKIMFQI